jgi:spermidine synthase
MEAPRMVLKARSSANQVLISHRTKYQHISVLRDKRGLLLSVNKQPQVHSAEERQYHDCIATIPLLLARKIDSILILGGGDGLAARNVFDFNAVTSCTLVELDQGMIDFCGYNPIWRGMNHGSLTDRRLNLIVGDGIAWMIKTKQHFDVIIHDLEMSFTKQPKKLDIDSFAAFFRAMYDKLTPGGVWVLTVDIDYDETLPDALFSVVQESLPASMGKRYSSLKGGIAKVRFLLHAIFPSVREITINPKALGKHTTFYISNAAIGRFHRKPPLPLSIPVPNTGL